MSEGLAQIESRALTTGMRGVFYKYSKRPEMDLSGPYRVTRISRDQDGEFVDFTKNNGSENDGTRVYLADDDDYGYPCFYVRQS